MNAVHHTHQDKGKDKVNEKDDSHFKHSKVHKNSLRFYKRKSSKEYCFDRGELGKMLGDKRSLFVAGVDEEELSDKGLSGLLAWPGDFDKEALEGETMKDQEYDLEKIDPKFLDSLPQNKQDLYKTELCRSWMENQTCRYGSKCQFAHGQAELRPVARHPKYKTEICKTFHSNGTCPYGRRCRFVHFPPKQYEEMVSEKQDQSQRRLPVFEQFQE
eukprot:TRINITY_DN2029_c0_g1_i2.p1 TRINITY_DN2029_c0_g1~~TRINITY_DN2029_c0_g1_i2.p1  ORF type:complete len:215 (-),score=24.64 TRINITY_DN2029_c0_g1_i2:9-653(-)